MVTHGQPTRLSVVPLTLLAAWGRSIGLRSRAVRGAVTVSGRLVTRAGAAVLLGLLRVLAGLLRCALACDRGHDKPQLARRSMSVSPHCAARVSLHGRPCGRDTQQSTGCQGGWRTCRLHGRTYLQVARRCRLHHPRQWQLAGGRRQGASRCRLWQQQRRYGPSTNSHGNDRHDGARECKLVHAGPHGQCALRPPRLHTVAPLTITRAARPRTPAGLERGADRLSHY